MPSSPLAALEEAERRLGRLSVTPERVEGGAIRCSGCGERVTGRYLVAPNKKPFHPECLRCELCGDGCETFASDPKRPNVLCCMNCHDERYAERCTRCDRPLKGEILTALGGKYHVKCFQCNLCSEPIARKFVEHPPGSQQIICPRCHEDKVCEKCDGCGRGMGGAFVRALGGKYHRECFKCNRCSRDVTSKYVEGPDGAPYCRGCHVKNFAPRCACGCGNGLEGNVTSAMGRKFIEGHFRCTDCDKEFRRGKFNRVANPEAGGDDRAVCEGCYRNTHAPRCAVCSTAMAGGESYVRNVDSDEAMCDRCNATSGSVCDDCGFCVPKEFQQKQRRMDFRNEDHGATRTARRASGGEAVIGQCERCAVDAVNDDVLAAHLMNKVIRFCTHAGASSAPGDQTVAVQLVAADRLARAADKRHRGPNANGPRGVTRTKITLEGRAPPEEWRKIMLGWRLERRGSGYELSENDGTQGEVATVDTTPVKGSCDLADASPGSIQRAAQLARSHPDVSVDEKRILKGVVALKGMSADALGAVLAHEYGHCYLFMRKFPLLPLAMEEGVCELFAWLWLGGGKWDRGGVIGSNPKDDKRIHAWAERRRRQMEFRKDPVYGDGFRAALRGYEACGENLWTFLEHLRLHESFPA
jgi:hypothetical protein